ncbi:MAG: hypothetical protein B6245_00910 [Desulfobacteraceae bacterium 4572_88]|nr:MAG: hypothetical protein B6245_00910 [Desulfobacteraceae bacterium 4572_88]
MDKHLNKQQIENREKIWAGFAVPRSGDSCENRDLYHWNSYSVNIQVTDTDRNRYRNRISG